MEAQLVYQTGMEFKANIRDLSVVTDVKSDQGGQNKGPSPKELLLTAIAGCSGMDVVSILKKMRIPFEGLVVDASADLTDNYPRIFKEVLLQFKITGTEVKPDKVKHAVELSLTTYCGVSAMVHPTSPVRYLIFINGEQIGEGKADFSKN